MQQHWQGYGSKRRTAILTLYHAVSHSYSGLHLALLLLLWREVLNKSSPGASTSSEVTVELQDSSLQNVDSSEDWRLLTVTAVGCSLLPLGQRPVTHWIFSGCKTETDRYSVNTCVNIISQHLRISGSSEVNRLHPCVAAFPCTQVITLFTQLEHPALSSVNMPHSLRDV